MVSYNLNEELRHDDRKLVFGLLALFSLACGEPSPGARDAALAEPNGCERSLVATATRAVAEPNGCGRSLKYECTPERRHIRRGTALAFPNANEGARSPTRD